MVLRQLLFNSYRRFNKRVCDVKQKPNPALKNITKDFKVYFAKVIDNSLEKATFIEQAEMKKRIKTFSEYYLTEVYPVQGEILVHAYEMIAKPKVVSDELLHQIQVIVTTMEMMQYDACIWDDFDENAMLRCGKPCWHLVNQNGNLSVIDAFLMRCFIDEIVRHNFKGELREQVLNILHRNYFIGNIGQCYDKMTSQYRNYDNFTMEHYNIINKNKSSFYSVKTPILQALALSNKLNEETYNVVDNVLTDLGISVQIHNDMMDYLNTIDAVKGKTGSDIQEGKCSWVAVAVLQKCNPEQRRVFVENYGSRDPERLNRIIQLYEEMDITKMYKSEQNARYDMFHKIIKELPENAVPSAEYFKSLQNYLDDYIQNTSIYMYNKT